MHDGATAFLSPDISLTTAWTFHEYTATLATGTGQYKIITNAAGGAAAIYADEFQVEAAAFASQRTPTTTVAVTRNADVESFPTAGNIAAAAGTVALEVEFTHAPSGTVALWGTYVDADNYTAMLHDGTNLIMRKRIAATSYDATIAMAFVSGTRYRVNGDWGATGVHVALDGVQGTPHANTTDAQIAATMQVGADGNSLQQPFAWIRNLRDWTSQLSANQEAAL